MYSFCAGGAAAYCSYYKEYYSYSLFFINYLHSSSAGGAAVHGHAGGGGDGVPGVTLLHTQVFLYTGVYTSFTAEIARINQCKYRVYFCSGNMYFNSAQFN